MLANDRKAAGRIVMILAIMSMLAGLVSAVVSTMLVGLFSTPIDITLGGMGFITGAVLIGSGLIAISNVIGHVWDS